MIAEMLVGAVVGFAAHKLYICAKRRRDARIIEREIHVPHEWGGDE